ELSLPQPSATDRPINYQVKLLQPLQRFSPDWRRADVAEIVRHGNQRSLTGIDRAIIGDALRVATDKTVGSFRLPGALRAIRRVDQSGNVSTAFHGDPLSWMTQFMPAVVARVEGFAVPRR